MENNLKKYEKPETVQPGLPLMKNNDQRKEWLRNYRAWGLWYEDEHIGAKYYKYDFENGAWLIVSLAGFEIAGRIILRDKATGREVVAGGDDRKREEKAIPLELS